MRGSGLGPDAIQHRAKRGALHRLRAAVDRDRRKEAHLRAPGCLVLRYSYGQIKEEPHFVIAEIAAALERRRNQTRA